MNEDWLFERVRMVAQAILDSLGHHAPRWHVLRVGWASEPTAAQPEEGHTIVLASWHHREPSALPAPGSRTDVSVVLGSPSDDCAEWVTANYSLDVPDTNAIAELASQIQDHAIEASWGHALPPCPGHSHPLAAHVVDGVAMWECPSFPEHHRQEILEQLRD